MEKIVFDKVSKVFDVPGKSSVMTLKEVSFSVKPNEILVIIGPSGCGKTTILNIIAGLLKPTQGRALFNDQPITSPSANRTMIFQEHSLFPWYSVRKNIEYGLVAKGIPAKQRRQVSDDLLRLINMEEFADFYPVQLSGGMKQRVALARALAVEPDVLLMDEPFGSLDAQTRSFLQQSLLNMWGLKKTTIIFVTHSITEALKLGNKILVLSRLPAENRDYIAIERPFSRNLLQDTYFSDMRLKIRNLLYEELKINFSVPDID